MDKKENFKILHIEDSDSFREAVKLLVSIYYEIDGAATIADGRKALEKHSYDVVILDRYLPDGDGINLIKEIKEESPNTAIIVVSNDGDFSVIKRAIDVCADDYVTKSEHVVPNLLIRIPQAVKKVATERKLFSLGERVKTLVKQEMVGQSKHMLELRSTIFSLKGSMIPVLITGESGTGKELVAQMLNKVECGARNVRPFVGVNCAEIKGALSRSELFGHERGSFTSAVERHPGKFEQAHNGDLFLDEVGELAWETQIELLRAIQEGEINRVGGSKPIKVSCRVIAATNCDLEDMVKRNKFRKDLYYRLKGVKIRTASLREHKEDIMDLAKFLAIPTMGANNKFSDSARKCLMDHDWPGNIRELQNTINLAGIKMKNRKGTIVELEDIVIEEPLNGPDAGVRRMEVALPKALTEVSKEGYREFMKLAEREYLRIALLHADDSVPEVASHIGVGRSTLFRRLEDIGLERRTYGLRVDGESLNTAGAAMTDKCNIEERA